MAILDRVKFEGKPGVLAWKFRSPRGGADDALCSGTQVIVNQSQEAVFFKGGQALDILGPGTHVLSTGNIPLLSRLVNLPFGGDTPFTAEIWFVDKTVRRELRWGTPAPIPYFDPEFQRPVNVRAHGGWGIRIADARSFITQIVGTALEADTEQLDRNFIVEISQHFAGALGKRLRAISPIQANAHLPELAEETATALQGTFARYGIELLNFNVASVTLPPDEMKALQDKLDTGMDEAARLRRIGAVTGTSDARMYNAIRSFDTLEKAAANEFGGAGNLLASGLGLGAGLGAGVAVGNAVGQHLQAATPPMPSYPAPTPVPVAPVPAPPPAADSFAAFNPPPAPAPLPSTPAPAGPAPLGDQANEPAVRLKKMKELLDMGLIEPEEFAACKKSILDQLTKG